MRFPRLSRALLLPVVLAPIVLAPVVGVVPAASAEVAASAQPRPIAPAVAELSVSGIDPAAAEEPAGRPAVRTGTSTRHTVLLTGRQATIDYALVGLTWRPDRAVGLVEASVRTRADGAWSAWSLIGGAADEDPDAGTPDTAGSGAGVRAGTSPFWVGSSDGVQVRLDVLSGADPTDLRVALVDPGQGAVDAAAAEPAAFSSTAMVRAGARPSIRSRAQWGADESLRTTQPAYAASVKAVIVHHTASTNDYGPADVPRLLRGIYAYHVKSRGWTDIAYNVLVDRFGTSWEGRAGGLDRAVIGAHAGGFNTGTAGISMIGTYEDVAPSAAQLESVAQVAAWKLGGVDPRASVKLVSGGGSKWPAGTVVSVPSILGHRQVSSTSCPGERGFAALPGLRERSAALVSGAPPSAGGLQIVAPSSARAGSVVDLVVRGGAAGQTVGVFFAKRGEPAATKRREARLADNGSYRTSFTVDDDYTVFALSGDRASLPATIRRSPARAGEPVTARAPLTVTGPVTAPSGGRVLVTATGPAASAVSLWFRSAGDEQFVRRRAGRFDSAGRFTTTYLADRPHEYFAVTSTVASAVAQTAVGLVPDGLHVFGPSDVAPGRTVPLVVQGTPGQRVELWFARREETTFTRRREAVLGPDGTYRTSYVATDDQTFFATSGVRSSTREITRLSAAPTEKAPPAAARLGLRVPAAVDAGTPVAVQVSGPAGASVQLWARGRGARTWSRIREGRFDPAGIFTASYAGLDDHELWAASGSRSTPDAQTLTVPVLTGPASTPLGARVRLTGRARPGDVVVVESRRRGASAFVRSTLTAGPMGGFTTSYAADDEYEYRPVVAARVGALRRTTVAPTVAGPATGRAGSVVTLAGTARPGASVEVYFRRDQPSTQIGSRTVRSLPVYRLGRTVIANAAGKWRTTFLLAGRYTWFARADGTATAPRDTAVR